MRPNLRRPKGLQVWTCPPLENVYPWDYGDPASTPPELRLAGVRNGTHSARLVVSCEAPIRGLKVKVSKLALEGGRGIPASAVLVRYSRPASKGTCWLAPYKFDILSTDPPAKVPVGPPLKFRPSRTKDPSVRLQDELPSRRPRANWDHYNPWEVGRCLPDAVKLPAVPYPEPGAVQPVWLTVHIPADAAPGVYHGKVTVRAAGAGPIDLPIRLKVYDWLLPEPKNFASHHNLYNSVDTLAQWYKTPLWSEKHWKLIGRSLELAARVGNKLCAVPLTVRAYNINNAQSMVRWIRRADGSYDHDFSILDKYLDLFADKVGKPGVLKLYVWGRYGNKKPDLYKVSLLDPKTGNVREMNQPPYGTPESLAFWKPMMAQLRKRLEKRRWMDVAVLAIGPDERPDPSTVTQFRRIWPDGRWMSTAHPNPRFYFGIEKERVPVPYVEHVWAAGRLYNPDYNDYIVKYRSARDWEQWHGHSYPRPWKRVPQRIEWAFPRYGVRCIHRLTDNSSLSSFRWISELALQGDLNGIGNCGADLWPLPGRKSSLAGTSHMGPAAALQALLSAGPDGPAVTERFEMFREGVQVCEAIIFLQQALDGGRAKGALARRIEELLDERARYLIRSRPGQEFSWWALNTGWAERDERLFALCAEVARSVPR